MFDRLRSLLTGRGSEVYECRRCGRTVEEETDRCPVCGAEGIASYTVE